MLEMQQPDISNVKAASEGDLFSEESRAEIWGIFEKQEEHMHNVRQNFAPGQMEFDDDYN